MINSHATTPILTAYGPKENPSFLLPGTRKIWALLDWKQIQLGEDVTMTDVWNHKSSLNKWLESTGHTNSKKQMAIGMITIEIPCTNHTTFQFWIIYDIYGLLISICISCFYFSFQLCDICYRGAQKVELSLALGNGEHGESQRETLSALVQSCCEMRKRSTNMGRIHLREALL